MTVCVLQAALHDWWLTVLAVLCLSGCLDLLLLASQPSVQLACMSCAPAAAVPAADWWCAVCSTPFLASIGWLSADELKRLKVKSKTNSSFGQQRQRMLDILAVTMHSKAASCAGC